jgi:hypothetical protein
MILLGCNHIYHIHCFRKWLTKREVCPLCNTFYPLSALNDGFYILAESTDTQYKVDNVYSSCNEFISRSALQGRKERARSFIINILKHNKRVWTKDEILKRYNESFDEYDFHQKLDNDMIDKILSKLISDEYITHSTIEVYEYNP